MMYAFSRLIGRAKAEGATSLFFAKRLLSACIEVLGRVDALDTAREAFI
jgi:hypothetical protein